MMLATEQWGNGNDAGRIGSGSGDDDGFIRNIGYDVNEKKMIQWDKDACIVET